MDQFVLGPKSVEQMLGAAAVPEFNEHQWRVAGNTTIWDSYLCARAAPLHHTLTFTLAGSGALQCEQGILPLAPGSLAILPAGERFTYYPSQEVSDTEPRWQFCWVIIEPSAEWRSIEGAARVLFTEGLGELISQGLHTLPLCKRSHTRKSLLHEMQLQLRPHLQSRELPTWQRQAKLDALWAGVEQQLHRPWHAGELAERLNCSVPSLHRYCLKAYGQTPNQLLVEKRLARAAELLLQTDWSLDHIAMLVGYSSGFALSKAFKRQHGLAPMRYREQASVSDKAGL